jgi:hypothetical protein
VSSSTVRLYDALKTEYPNKVYLGQFDQSANLRSTDSVVMLEMIDQNPSYTKDLAKRDQINYKIHVVGALQKEVEQKANEIRDLIEPYNDEYIYLMKFEGIETIYEDEAETYRKVVNFICFPQQDGLNTPTGYWEYYAYMDFIDGSIEVINLNDLNYLPISWTYTNDGAAQFVATHNYNAADVVVFWELPNNQGNQMDLNNECTNSTLTLTSFESDLFQETRMLIRVRKDVSGQFGGG